MKYAQIGRQVKAFEGIIRFGSSVAGSAKKSPLFEVKVDLFQQKINGRKKFVFPSER